MTGTPSPTERREHVRIPLFVRVDYQVVDSGNVPLSAEVGTAFTQDLSDQGLKLELTHVPAAIMERLTASQATLGINIDLHLPKSTLRLPARIVWLEKLGGDRCLVGLQFTYVTESNAAEVMRFAHKYATRAPLLRWVAIVGVIAALVGAAAAFHALS